MTDLQELIEPIVSDIGCELWCCEYLPQGKHSVLRIYIDKPGGINIDDCELVSKRLSAIFDINDPIKTNYYLEVSSPGIPRPLFFKKHYQLYIGQEIQLKLTSPVGGTKKLKGIIDSVNDNSITIKSNDELQELPFSQIAKAHLIGE